MRKHLSTILLILLFLIGLSLLLYPSVSNYWNDLHQTRAIVAYSDALEKLNESTYQAARQAAVDYNDALRAKLFVYEITQEEREEYNSLLDILGTGMMGYVEIPTLDVSLPIYHGTAESVLQTAVGHLEWSSLPVGGAGTHAVLSGHRGLPSARLFTDLDKLEEGDLFMLQVLHETLTYEVDQILIVEPQQIAALMIEPDQDYCTLLTCTPYGINTHRLLIRGHRVANQEEAEQVRITADAIRVETLVVTPVIAVPILLGLLVLVLVKTRKKKSKEKKERQNECCI